MQVVPALDPLEDRYPGLGLRLEPTPIEQFLLKVSEFIFGLDGNKIEAVTGVELVGVIGRITK